MVDNLNVKSHKYLLKFNIKVKNKKYLIEVKPERFTREPKIPQRKTKRFISEVKQWGVNLAKWEAAKEVCLDNGWEFKIITEKELGISYK